VQDKVQDVVCGENLHLPHRENYFLHFVLNYRCSAGPFVATKTRGGGNRPLCVKERMHIWM
jgi:hypothetical protein